MTQLFNTYLQQNNYTQFDLKAVLFDMDGVLYDSMPAHAQSWQETMEEFGLKLTKSEDFYLHEGRPADFTINILFKNEFHRDATPDEIKEMYARKSELFAKYNTGAFIEGAKELLYLVKSRGLVPVLVTGSKQPTLLDRLDDNFPDIFTPKTMVTAFDTEIGKPHPEPFLMGLEKGGNLKPNQAIAIENAPLGAESATQAGIFTICVNTGPLDDKILADAGANIVFHSMKELLDNFSEIMKITSTIRNN